MRPARIQSYVTIEKGNIDTVCGIHRQRSRYGQPPEDHLEIRAAPLEFTRRHTSVRAIEPYADKMDRLHYNKDDLASLGHLSKLLFRLV